MRDGCAVSAVLKSLGVRRSLAEQGPQKYIIPAVNGVIIRLAAKVAGGHCFSPTTTAVPKQLRYINASTSDPVCCHSRAVEAVRIYARSGRDTPALIHDSPRFLQSKANARIRFRLFRPAATLSMLCEF